MQKGDTAGEGKKVWIALNENPLELILPRPLLPMIAAITNKFRLHADPLTCARDYAISDHFGCQLIECVPVR